MQYVDNYNSRKIFENQQAMDKIMEVASRGGNISEVTIKELERVSLIDKLEKAV